MPVRPPLPSLRSLVATALTVLVVAAAVPAAARPASALPYNPGDVVDCGDFPTWNEAQVWYETFLPFFGDVADLDPDGDGVPCENLPGGPRVAPLAPAVGAGYWMLERNGTVFGFGDATPLVPHVDGLQVAIAAAPNGGYWVLGAAGTVSARAAVHYGDVSVDALTLPGEHLVALAGRPDGLGYWAFSDRGRVLGRGAAGWHGDLVGVELRAPIVGAASTPSGEGYWMVAADGGVFAFGDAAFWGSTGGMALNAPVLGLAADPDGSGYWLVASDGGVFAFAAPFLGSVPGALPSGQSVNEPVVGVFPYGSGYVAVASDGGIFSFSDRPFLGSLGATPPTAPIVGVAVRR